MTGRLHTRRSSGRGEPYNTPMALDPGAFRRPCNACGKLIHIGQFRRRGKSNARSRTCKACEAQKETQP